METEWTIWYDRKSLNKQESDAYVEGLHPLGSFNTIEGFYANYAYLMRPHDLPSDINIHLFRKGFKPMWEEFPDGGCWSMRLAQKSGEKAKVDGIWESIILGLIGEQYEMPDIVGCVLSRRSQFDMISVWNMTSTSANTFRIGETTKALVRMRESKTFILTYKSFMEAMRDFSTYRNAKGYKFGNSNTMTPALLCADSPGTPPLPPTTPEKKSKKKKSKSKLKKSLFT